MVNSHRSMSEVNNIAFKVLEDNLGVIDTIRFLEQFDPGHGNYTKEKYKKEQLLIK